MAVVDKAGTPFSRQLVESLKARDFLAMDPKLSEEAPARQSLQDGDIGFVLIVPEAMRGMAPGAATGPGPVELTLLYDEANVRENQVMVGILRQFLDEANLGLLGATRSLSLREEGLYSRRVGYFGFVVPGNMGMGVMVFSITYLAASIAQYRQRKILKRMLATPP